MVVSCKGSGSLMMAVVGVDGGDGGVVSKIECAIREVMTNKSWHR